MEAFRCEVIGASYEEEFDLAIQTAQVIVGSTLDRIEYIAAHANEE